MIIKEEQIKALEPYIQNVREFDDAQELLDAIDDLIVDNMLGNNDEPDMEGIKLQRIYDQIFMQNSN